MPVSAWSDQKRVSTMENTKCISRSGGGSEVHQEEWNKQKANEYEDFDKSHPTQPSHTQIHCFHVGTTECFKDFLILLKQDKNWDSPQTIILNQELYLNSSYGYCLKWRFPLDVLSIFCLSITQQKGLHSASADNCTPKTLEKLQETSQLGTWLTSLHVESLCHCMHL